jgi:hypothetical protein
MSCEGEVQPKTPRQRYKLFNSDVQRTPGPTLAFCVIFYFTSLKNLISVGIAAVVTAWFNGKECLQITVNHHA